LTGRESLNESNGLRYVISRRRIGHESFGFGGGGRPRSSLDDLSKWIAWTGIDVRLSDISCAATGEAALPPIALFKALLLAVWYDFQM
jgi:IS5 family transposase